MSLTQEDAANSLRLADEAGRHSRTLRGYQSAAPHLIVWGCIYAAAYTLCYFRPQQAGIVWLVIVPLGMLGDVAIAWRDLGSRLDWRPCAVLSTTFVVLVIATAFIMRPHDPRQMSAFVPLLVACLYIALGLRLGLRITLAGVALGGLTLFGYFALHPWFMLWMAAVGGGTLVLSGLWLRRA
jgi:hypothetical protein